MSLKHFLCRAKVKVYDFKTKFIVRKKTQNQTNKQKTLNKKNPLLRSQV